MCLAEQTRWLRARRLVFGVLSGGVGAVLHLCCGWEDGGAAGGGGVCSGGWVRVRKEKEGRMDEKGR